MMFLLKHYSDCMKLLRNKMIQMLKLYKKKQVLIHSSLTRLTMIVSIYKKLLLKEAILK